MKVWGNRNNGATTHMKETRRVGLLPLIPDSCFTGQVLPMEKKTVWGCQSWCRRRHIFVEMIAPNRNTDPGAGRIFLHHITKNSETWVVKYIPQVLTVSDCAFLNCSRRQRLRAVGGFKAPAWMPDLKCFAYPAGSRGSIALSLRWYTDYNLNCAFSSPKPLARRESVFRNSVRVRALSTCLRAYIQVIIS